MFTNADITLYSYSKDGKTERYTRKPIRNVFLDDVRQSTFLKTGQSDATSVLLVIPMSSLEEPLALTQGKDLVVLGIIEDEIDSSTQEALSESLSALNKAHKCVMITSVDAKLYGSPAAQHYELACK